MLIYQERRTADTKTIRKVILISAVAVLAVVAASIFVTFKQIDVNEFDDSHRPFDTFHDVTFFLNYPDAGVPGTEGGKVRHNDTFTFSVIPTNPGYIFVGWFSDKRIVSKELTFDFPIDHDFKLEARFLKVYDTSFIITQTDIVAPMDMTFTPIPEENLTSRSWQVLDLFTKKQVPYTQGENGSITIHMDKGAPIAVTHTRTFSGGGVLTQTSTIVINEDVIKTFTWKYQRDNVYSPIANLLSFNSGSVTWNVLIPVTEYYWATVDDIPRWGTGAYARIQDYVTDESRVMVHMAENLSVFTENMSDLARAEFVLKFVQSIPYVDDIKSKGIRDYYKYPVETLWEQNGDCEDHAILFASLMKALGYKVVLYHVYVYSGGKMIGGHVAAGVAVEGARGYSTIVDGGEYFYCEATAEVGTSWLNQANIGYIPSGYKIVETWEV